LVIFQFYLVLQFILSITSIKSLTNFHKTYLQIHSFYLLNLLKKIQKFIHPNLHKFIFILFLISIPPREHTLR